MTGVQTCALPILPLPSSPHWAPINTTAGITAPPLFCMHLLLDRSPITDHRSPITDHRSPITDGILGQGLSLCQVLIPELKLKFFDIRKSDVGCRNSKVGDRKNLCELRTANCELLRFSPFKFYRCSHRRQINSL